MGTLDRIAKRRYTRELFDDIIAHGNRVSKMTPPSSSINKSKSIGEERSDHVESTKEEEGLITLLRCFNNFFNRTFDADRLFKALQYIMVSPGKSAIISSWLSQKKADHIYVVGRFILQIACFLESSKIPLDNAQSNLIRQFLDLVFIDSSDILDENYILIFGFLARKGFFRSIMGFLDKHKINAIGDWTKYLQFPLSFAVNWRIKVEQWMKRELEKKEIYGSNGSLDEDYACSAIMNQSIISVGSTDMNMDEPHSRQTRIFLKRLLSSWFNSIYFSDSFFGYLAADSSIELANQIVMSTVPLYLIILAILEPLRLRRRYSIDSIQGVNKTLIVLYKLNITPSIGCLKMFVSNACVEQFKTESDQLGQEEAYGVIVIIHLLICGIIDQFNRDNQETKFQLTPIPIGRNIENLIQLALSSDQLDPDVVLPFCYFYQNLRHEFQLDNYALFRCKLQIIRKPYLLRYNWNVLNGAIPVPTTRRTSSSSGPSPGSKSSTSSDNFTAVDLRVTLLKTISAAQLNVSDDDFIKYIIAMTTYLECMICYMNTLYVGETRRKMNSSNSMSNQMTAYNVSLGPLLWTTELAEIARSLIHLTRGLIGRITPNQEIFKTGTENFQRYLELLKLIRIFLIHIMKLNTEHLILHDEEIELILKSGFFETKDSFDFMFQFDMEFCNCTNDEIIMKKKIMLLEIIPFLFNTDNKLQFVSQLFRAFTKHVVCDNKHGEDTEHQMTITRASTLFKEFYSYYQKRTLSEIMTHLNDPITVNFTYDDSPDNIKVYKLIELIPLVLKDGISGTANQHQLFSRDANQSYYPNPYTVDETQHKCTDQSNCITTKYYNFIGQLIGLILLNEQKIEEKFAIFFLERLLINEGAIYNINDLNCVDLEVAKNLMLLSKADEDGLECFRFNFTLTLNSFGKLHKFEIVKNGESIPVTIDNKDEYIHRVVEFIMNKQINLQTQFIRNGLSCILPAQMLQILTPFELQKLLSRN